MIARPGGMYYVIVTQSQQPRSRGGPQRAALIEQRTGYHWQVTVEHA
jgi:hypothetical protein